MENEEHLILDWLKSEWLDLVLKYSNNPLIIKRLFADIVKHYSAKNRHYHNLTHIYNMLVLADKIKDNITDYDSFRFAIWYHDIIYNATSKQNEEKSAVFAEKCLKRIDFHEKRIKNVQKLIISTKNHEVLLKDNLDNAYLLDLDLSILGTAWEVYEEYTQNIRKEYRAYPDFLYNSGRKKVLYHFLNRDDLYFTNTFKTPFETLAKANIKHEIGTL